MNVKMDCPHCGNKIETDVEVSMKRAAIQPKVGELHIDLIPRITPAGLDRINTHYGDHVA